MNQDGNSFENHSVYFWMDCVMYPLKCTEAQLVVSDWQSWGQAVSWGVKHGCFTVQVHHFRLGVHRDWGPPQVATRETASFSLIFSNKTSNKDFIFLTAGLRWGRMIIFAGWLILAIWAVTLLSNILQWLQECCFMRSCLIITVALSCTLFMVIIELLYEN